MRVWHKEVGMWHVLLKYKAKQEECINQIPSYRSQGLHIHPYEDSYFVLKRYKLRCPINAEVLGHLILSHSQPVSQAVYLIFVHKAAFIKCKNL